MSRWLRCLICLVLICCILVNLSPIRAEATTVVAPVFAGAATVTVSAPMVIGAALIALGIAAGTSDDFQRVVDDAVSAAGDWVKDGTVELLQTIDSAGQKAYYVAGEMLEVLRSWAFDSGVVYRACSVIAADTRFDLLGLYERYCSVPCTRLTANFTASNAPSGYIDLIVNTDGGFYLSNGTSASTKNKTINDVVYKYLIGYGYTTSNIGAINLGHLTPSDGQETYELARDMLLSMYASGSIPYTSSSDLSLGILPTVPVDGTSAREWASDYADKGLHVIEGGGDDNNNGRWFWPIALFLTLVELWAASQADEWSGETPQEFDDYETVVEWEVLPGPEVEFGQGIEIQPISDPSPDTGGDTGEDPDPTTGGDSGEDPEPTTGGDPGSDPDADPNAEAKTLRDIWESIMELPQKVADAFNPSPSGDVKPGSFFLDLRNYFPFCIPFDIGRFLNALIAPATAPVFHWEIQDLSGNVYEIDVDLSPWDPHAALFRDIELAFFILGLCFITRKLIKW